MRYCCGVLEFCEKGISVKKIYPTGQIFFDSTKSVLRHDMILRNILNLLGKFLFLGLPRFKVISVIHLVSGRNYFKTQIFSFYLILVSNIMKLLKKRYD